MQFENYHQRVGSLKFETLLVQALLVMATSVLLGRDLPDSSFVGGGPGPCGFSRSKLVVIGMGQNGYS